MKNIKVTLPDATVQLLTDEQEGEHYATEVCNRYGWSVRSPAWYDLASTRQVADSFLLERALVMHPGATVELVAA